MGLIDYAREKVNQVMSVQPEQHVAADVAPRQRLSTEKVVILLVGITGHGKSRLGSYLISPNDTYGIRKAAFQFSEQHAALTQVISPKQVQADGNCFELVDTPGFGEKPQKDLEHTQQFVEYLQVAGEVSAVVFCYKSGRFEAEGKRLVTFLKALFGDRVIQTNLLLVVTHVSQGKNALIEREANGLSLEQVMAGMRQEVQTAFGLKGALPVVDIDTKAEGEQAEQIALMRRLEIFRLAAQLPVVKVVDLAIPKPQLLLDEDKIEMIRLEVSIKEMQKSIKAKTPDEQRIMHDIKERTEELSECGRKLERLQTHLKDVGSNKLEKCGYAEGARGRQYFLPEPVVFVAKSDIAVAKYETHLRDPDDKMSVTKIDTFTYKMSIMPSSKRIGTCQGHIVLYAERRDLHSSEVKLLETEMQACDKQIAFLQAKIEKLKNESENVKKQYTASLSQDIADAQAMHKSLSNKTMTVAEAQVRLKQLRKRVSSDDIAQPLFGAVPF